LVNDLKVTAIHEAGHAVAGVLMGLDVGWATVDPAQSLSGGPEVGYGPGEPFAEAVCALAGMAAVSIAGGPKDLQVYRWGRDFAEMEKAIALLSPPAANRVGPFTLELIYQHWDAVRRVSAALQDRPVLGRTELLRLVKGDERGAA
jgi:hypothetical protein